MSSQTTNQPKEKNKIGKKITGWMLAIGAVAATIVAIWAIFIKKNEDIEKRYDADIAELTKPHNNDDFSSSKADNLLKDLKKVIEDKADRDPNMEKALRTDFAKNLVDQFQDNSLDFSKSGNLQLDQKALSLWGEYPEQLKQNPKANRRIIYRFTLVLRDLYEREREMVESARFNEDREIQVARKFQPKNQTDKVLLNDLTFLFEKHIDLLRRSLGEEVDSAQNQEVIKSMCDYYLATKNPFLTQKIFPLEDSKFANLIIDCSKT